MVAGSSGRSASASSGSRMLGGLEEGEAAGARRRRRQDFVAAETAPDGLAKHGAVVLEVVAGEEPAAFLRLLDEAPGQPAFVEVTRARSGDPFQGAGQIFLLEHLPPAPGGGRAGGKLSTLTL